MVDTRMFECGKKETFSVNEGEGALFLTRFYVPELSICININGFVYFFLLLLFLFRFTFCWWMPLVRNGPGMNGWQQMSGLRWRYSLSLGGPWPIVNGGSSNDILRPRREVPLVHICVPICTCNTFENKNGVSSATQYAATCCDVKPSLPMERVAFFVF